MLKLKHAFFLMSVSPVIFSATQGNLATTSQGTVAISITVPNLVQISGLSDIAIAPTSFATAATGSTTACIYSNVSTGTYYVTATSANASAGGFFAKLSTGSPTIGYSAFWNNAATVGGIALTSGTKTAQQTGGSTTSLTCGGTPNANFNISVSAAQATGVVNGLYQDTATLLITPT